MIKLNYAEAKKDVFRNLKELPENLYYHNPGHTEDVGEVVERLARLENIPKIGLILLKTGALYHDTGFLEQYQKNEPIGARIAKESLPRYGYKKKQIESIANMIMATQLPQNPQTKLEGILCDADLDNFGRGDFFDMGALLRKELEEHGIKMSDKDWYEGTLKLLENHHYFTESARKLRQEKKQENIRKLKEKLGKI